MKSTIRRRTMLTLAGAVFGLSLPAEASITLCNRGEKTLAYEAEHEYSRGELRRPDGAGILK